MVTNNNNIDLSKLPPPPKGQTGLSANELAKLPPPPKGQTGMTLDELQNNSKNLPPGSQFAKPDSINNFVPNLKTDFQGLKQDNQNLDASKLSLPSKILGNVGNVFSGISDIVGEGAKAVGLDKVISMLPTIGSDGKPTTLGEQLPKSVAMLKQVAADIDKHHQVAKAIEDFHTQFPGSTEALKNVLQITGGLLNASGVSDILEGGYKTLSETGKNTVETTGKTEASVKNVTEGTSESKMPKLEPTKPVQTTTINPFKKAQQFVTAVPGVVRGSIKTIARTLENITDPALREEVNTELRNKFTNIMQSAKDSLSNPDALKPHDVVGEQAIKPAIEDFNAQKDAIGKKIGEYKDAIGDKVVPGIKNVYEKFKSDVESTLRKKFDSMGGVPFESGKVSLEDQAAFKAKGGDFSNIGDGKPRLVDTGKVSIKLGSAEKQIVQTFQDFQKAMEGGTVSDLDTIKTNMQNIIAKVGEESPSLTKQVGRIFTTAYKGMSKAIDAVAKDNGIEDWAKTNEEYGKFNDASKDLNGVTDSQGKVDYSKLSKSSLTSNMKNTFDFLQSKTGIPVRAYSEFANWAEKAYQNSKINDLVKTLAVKTAGLPMMGFGRQVGNLVGDIPGKTFSLIDKELGGGASQLEKAVNASGELKSTLKSMGMSTKQGVLMLLSGLEKGGAKGVTEITGGKVVNDESK